MKEVNIVYVAGARSLFWGLINFGGGKNSIEKQFAEYVSQGWDIAPFNTEAGRNVFFGLYKSAGWFVALTRQK